ncbi:MAG TPA: GNAT family N-acetyltransferase [Candidatus Sulfotelmatobacter sp.]|nr:GNAT family N-acetyltransferase [Candidatus Sulfotelmatobacter sp.]
MTTTEREIDIHPAATSMVVEAECGGLEVIERWADKWRALSKIALDDQPFYRPEWIGAHIRAFTPKARIFLLTVRSEGELLFVLPLLQEWATFDGVPLRVLRAPVNSHSQRFDAVRHAGPKGEAAVSEAWNYLRTRRDWHMLALPHAPEGGTLSALARVAGRGGAHVGEVTMEQNPYVPLPGDSAGLNKLPANARLRSKLRQIRRELAAQGADVKFTCVENADPAVLQRFYELEAAGWKGAEGSAISCNLDTRQFYDQIAAAGERFGYLRIYSLEVNGELLACHFGLCLNGRYYSPKIAYNEKFPQFAPGHLIVSEILQDCVNRQIPEYDITGVVDDWKSKWTAQSRTKLKYFIFRPGFPASLAYAIRFELRPWLKKLLRR